MNHWFLCARDVMWFCLSMVPLLLFFLGQIVLKNGEKSRRCDDAFIGWSCCVVAALLQWFMIGLIYCGDIR